MENMSPSLSEEEISKILHWPIGELRLACRDPQTLSTVISLAIQMGINVGRQQTLRQYNEMFTGYNRQTLEN